MPRPRISRPVRHGVWLAVGALLFLGCPKKEEPRPTERRLTVRTRRLVPTRYELKKTFVGEVRPWREFTLSPQVGGLIAVVHCEKGDEVSTGDVLVQIDDRDLQFDLRDALAGQAEAEQSVARMRSLTRPQEIETLRARCEQCSATLVQARLEFDRARRLLRDKVTSKSQYDRAKAAYDAAIAQAKAAREELKLAEEGARTEDVRAAEVRLERAEVAVERARKRIADARIESPAKALVLRRHREIGEAVRIGEPLVDLIEIDRVKIVLHVAEQDAVRFREGLAVVVGIDSIPDRMFHGRIHYVSDAVAKAMRTFEVEIAVWNTDHALKPGMVARATVVVDTLESALVIPDTIVAEYEGGKGVFYLDEGRAKFLPLEGGIRDGDHWILPRPDALPGPVVETRTSRLAPGLQVETRQERETAQ